MTRGRILSSSLAAVLLIGTSIVAEAKPVFIIGDLGGASVDTPIRDVFLIAASRWASFLTDDVTIRINIGSRVLAGAGRASALSRHVEADYEDVRAALLADRTSDIDRVATRALQSDPLSFMSNEPGTCPACGPINPASRTLDADNTIDNNVLQLTSANARALGLDAGADPFAADGTIWFNCLVNPDNFCDEQWDFNRADGVTPGKVDFLGVAMHEIGHVLGFESGLDQVEFMAQHGGQLDNNVYVTPLDLFRYHEGVMDMTVNTAACFSLTGAVCLAQMSTGDVYGDGRSGSHWKDDLFTGAAVGVMDPSVAGPVAGINPALNITDRDLIAMDAIGWDLERFVPVPVPATAPLMAIGLLGLVYGGRKRANE